MLVQLTQRQIQHLYLRGGFGLTPKEIPLLLEKSKEEIVIQLLAHSSDYRPITYLPYPLNEREEQKGASSIQILKMILQSKQDMEELNLQWIFKMTWTKAQLRERMTLFWHHHFATSVPFAWLMQEQNNRLRKHALGKFGDLLMAVSKDPAMLIYLNNQQNKKGHPNENFARELLELFTLGEGHYTEQDIREAARAFTGWATDNRGRFAFNAAEHDTGIKEFMGEKGNFGGEDIIRIVLSKPQCARFIVIKIYRELVNPEVNSKVIEKLSDRFFQSGYDISSLLKDIFLSDWFYAEENIGVKIASPVELLVRMHKLAGLQFSSHRLALDIQQILGQVLFFPPNVSGWKGGEQWIDSASLLLRLNIPIWMLKGSAVTLEGKPAFEEENRMKPKTPGKLTADWQEMTTHFQNLPTTDLLLQLLNFLLQRDIHESNESTLTNGTEFLHGKDRIAHLTSNIMSTPEFQLI